MTPSPDDRRRFGELFVRLSPRVYGYARRRTDTAAAHDVVAETFLVAWRRYAVLPRENELPWLLGVARNVLRAQGRSTVRDEHLAASWAAAQPVAQPGTDDLVAERDALYTGLLSLSDGEREAMMLVAWDGLTAAQAATVCGCSVKAFEVRLSRARARLRRSLGTGDGAGAPAPAVRALTRPAPITREAQ